MALAENASSRKEARHLINESTKLMENTKPVKPSRFSLKDLNRFLDHQQDILSAAESRANAARQMIQMIEDTIKVQQEAGE